jgi:hypothetical protein
MRILKMTAADLKTDAPSCYGIGRAKCRSSATFYRASDLVTGLLVSDVNITALGIARHWRCHQALRGRRRYLGIKYRKGVAVRRRDKAAPSGDAASRLDRGQLWRLAWGPANAQRDCRRGTGDRLCNRFQHRLRQRARPAHAERRIGNGVYAWTDRLKFWRP